MSRISPQGHLIEAALVIADLTEHNPNVLFELGVRMAHDKPERQELGCFYERIPRRNEVCATPQVRSFLESSLLVSQQSVSEIDIETGMATRLYLVGISPICPNVLPLPVNHARLVQSSDPVARREAPFQEITRV